MTLRSLIPEKRSKRPINVALITTCSRCGEAIELVLSKKEVKAIYKGFKASSTSQAEILAEKHMENILKARYEGKEA